MYLYGGLLRSKSLAWLLFRSVERVRERQGEGNETIKEEERIRQVSVGFEQSLVALSVSFVIIFPTPRRGQHIRKCNLRCRT